MNRRSFLGMLAAVASALGFGKLADAKPKAVPHILKFWYYEQGNNASKTAILQAAKDQSDKVNIAVPYDPNNPNRRTFDERSKRLEAIVKEWEFFKANGRPPIDPDDYAWESI
jgi:hypothetical protein